MEPTMYCGAMGCHVHCENFDFKINEILWPFKRKEVDERTTWLDVKNASGVITSETFTLFPNLKVLNFTNCTLEVSPKAFASLKKLTSLSIRNCNILIGNEMFEGSETLEHLSLYTIKIPDKECFKHLKNLENLLIEECDFENSMGDTFKNLQNLKYFILNNSRLNGLKDIFEDMKNLEQISITSNKIGEFDYKSIPKLQKLQNLSIFNNEISTDINYKVFENMLPLENIMFNTWVLRDIDFHAFPSLKCVQIGTLTDIVTDAEQELIDKLESLKINYQYTFCGKIQVDMSKVQICG